MSDFLGNLAARSLGRLETLKPRLPSRFEPAGPAASLEGLEVEREAVASDVALRARLQQQPLLAQFAREIGNTRGA